MVEREREVGGLWWPMRSRVVCFVLWREVIHMIRCGGFLCGVHGAVWCGVVEWGCFNIVRCGVFPGVHGAGCDVM